MMRVALVVALLGLTSACVSSDKLRASEDKARSARAEADQARSRASELEAKLSANERELGEAREESRTLKAKVDELSASTARLASDKEELQKKSVEYERMAAALRGQIDSGRIELTELRGKMTVKMKDKILFSSGSATLGKDGREALSAVAEVLRGVQGRVVRVEGHTDNVRLTRSKFASNWQLSVARALAVVSFLQGAGVDPTRLAAAGYGEFQPIASNDTPEGRSQNRRIEIVLAPADGPEAVAPAKK
jgi:chemotaxis protein MotB